MGKKEKKILNIAMEKIVLLMEGQIKITKEENFAAQRDSSGKIELDADGNPLMIKVGEKIKTEHILPDEKTIHFVIKALNKEAFGDVVKAKVDKEFKIIHEIQKNENISEGEQCPA